MCRDCHGAPDHVDEPVRRVEPLHVVHLHPLRLVGVAGRAQRSGHRKRHVVDQHPMIANAPLAIAHDTVEDAGHLAHADLEPALLGHLAQDRLARRLAELHQPARQAPLPHKRRLAPTHQEDAAAVEDDGAHADAGDAGVLPSVTHAEAASQAGLA